MTGTTSGTGNPFHVGTIAGTDDMKQPMTSYGTSTGTSGNRLTGQMGTGGFPIRGTPGTQTDHASTLDALIGRARPRWILDALCREYPHLEFVPANPRTEANAREQLQVCGRCTVRTECLTWALDDPTLLGILGGTNTAARRATRLNRQIATTTTHPPQTEETPCPDTVDQHIARPAPAAADRHAVSETPTNDGSVAKTQSATAAAQPATSNSPTDDPTATHEDDFLGIGARQSEPLSSPHTHTRGEADG